MEAERNPRREEVESVALFIVGRHLEVVVSEGGDLYRQGAGIHEDSGNLPERILHQKFGLRALIIRVAWRTRCNGYHFLRRR